jgi:hypothetical protein
VWKRVDQVGVRFTAAYLLMLAALYLFAANSKPAHQGYDWVPWLPFYWLTTPWTLLHPGLLIPGIFLNALFFYVFGTFLHSLYEYIMEG